MAEEELEQEQYQEQEEIINVTAIDETEEVDKVYHEDINYDGAFDDDKSVELEDDAEGVIYQQQSDEDPTDLFYKNTSSFRCLAQVLISRSSLLRHILYPFPPLKDPGIDEVFFYVEPEPVYDDIGCEKYKNVCKDLEIVPISRVIRSLPTETLNLKFYGLSDKQIRAICTTLMLNAHVKTVILQDNWISPDACFYLGEMIRENNSVAILNLKECRIGPEGAPLLVEGLSLNQSICELDLSFNNLGDDGLNTIISALRENQLIQKLHLGHNNLGDRAGKILGDFLKENTSVDYLDLCWNDLYNMIALKDLCRGLTENTSVKYLNLSWNAIGTLPAVMQIVRYLANTEVLEHLDLSNNRLMANMLNAIKGGINKNKSLLSINLGFNLITPQEALMLINVFNTATSLEYMDLENVFVFKSFVPTWRKFTKQGKNIRIQGILNNFEVFQPDINRILFRRCIYLSQKPKKKKKRVNFGHFIYSLPDKLVEKVDFKKMLKKYKLKMIDADLAEGIAQKFKKNNKVDLEKLKREYLEMYPDTEPPPPKKKKPKKGKKGKRAKKVDNDQEVQTDTSIDVHDHVEIRELEDIAPHLASRKTHESIVGYPSKVL